jgi:ABC-type branched-subunit amino acid transport system substrate-binding protein
VEFITAMKHTAVQPQYYALSFFTAGASIKQLGADARGISVTQVMPKPNAASLPLVREFHDAMGKYAPESKISYFSLEGYVTGMVLAEGLRRAGKSPSREKFVKALESFRNLNLGGMFLSYSPTDHAGLKRAEITVIGHGGQVVQ